MSSLTHPMANRASHRARFLKRAQRGWTMALGVTLVFAVGLGVGVVVAPGSGSGQGQVAEKKLLDNERVQMFEFVFPPGFKGEEHEAHVDECAYVLDGQFGVVT